MLPKRLSKMSDSANSSDPQGHQDEAPSYVPRGDFLIGLAQEAIEETIKRKVEQEIEVVKSALEKLEGQSLNRRYQQLIKRLDKLEEQITKKDQK